MGVSKVVDEDVERRIEYMPLALIDAAPRNPKRHAGPDIRNSLTRFGFAELPLLDERTGRLVAGHGRLDQVTEMHRAGAEPPRYVRVDPHTGDWLVPVQRGWASEDDQHAEAYVIASNHLTSKGGWDHTELGDVLTDLRDADHALFLSTGFTDDYLDGLLEPPPDDPGDPGEGGEGGTGSTITRTGDLWHLGAHRLACGEPTDPEIVARLFAGYDAATLILDDIAVAAHPDPVHVNSICRRYQERTGTTPERQRPGDTAKRKPVSFV